MVDEASHLAIGRVLIVFTIVVAMAGCGMVPYTRNVTSQFASREGYTPGGLYVTKTNMFIDPYNEALPPGTAGAPDTIPQYLRGRIQGSASYQLLRSGTILEFEKSIVDYSPDNGSTLSVYANIVKGNDKGAQVDLFYVSNVNGGPDATMIRSIRPNPKYLERIVGAAGS